MELPDYYENLIRIQRREIRAWWTWVIVVALAGTVIILYNVAFPPGSNSELTKLGGALIGVCATYPYKNIPPRRERIATFEQLKSFYETTPISEDEKRQLFMSLGSEALKVTLQRGPNA